MRDPVRVTLENDDEERTVRIHDDEGELSVDDATVRFELSGVTAAGGETDDGVDEDGSEADSDGGQDDGDTVEAGSDVANDPQYIAPVDEIPANGTLRFEALDGRYGVEGILQRNDGTVLAWENSCPHEPEVRLDKGFGALVNDDQIVCHKHGARFDCDDGFCTRGPCRGSVLDAIEVEVRDEAVFLADERFEAGHCLDL
jgi:nitrite reductase/ring-hydroxylating ferredoxin subunit